MKRLAETILLSVLIIFGVQNFSFAAEEKLLSSLDSKKEFAREISTMIDKAWRKWQDSVIIDDIEVEGSRGLLTAGDISDPILTSSSIMEYFDRSGRSQSYIYCTKAVTDAVGNGMRIWQKGYTHDNIPFPQGASASFTLTPCHNVPVTLDSGYSAGDKDMTEEALYNFMLYRCPGDTKDVLVVFKATSVAFSECFKDWERSCSIVGILASGGIAPQPAPMGSGPGPVRGAKGDGGKLIGKYFNGDQMYKKMVAYLEENQ